MIQNLKFRDVWVFVGQKGIDGFGDLEQVKMHVDSPVVSIVMTFDPSVMFFPMAVVPF